jgi:hypothetical protein
MCDPVNRRSLHILVGIAAGALTCAPGAFAQERQQNGAPVLTVGHVPDGVRPLVDGRVDDEVWALAESFDTFVQQEPNEGEPATERTEVKFLLDR